MEYREFKIATLKAKITEHHERLRNKQEKELEVLRPVMDDLHGKICAIQNQMARLWTDYTARLSTAHETTSREIEEFQKIFRSLEQEDSKSKSFLAPIAAELLAEIFGIVIECYGQSPFAMMRVCWSWRATVLIMARVWSQFTVQPWTSQGKMDFVVERTKQVPLDVVVNLNANHHSSILSFGARKEYGGLALAVTTMPRWRTLTITGFPCESTATWEGKFPITFSRSLGRLEAFKIEGLWGPTPPSESFSRLLDTVAITSTEALTYVEVATPNAPWFLALPTYRPFLSCLRHFKVNVREMRDPTDILPYFENLEVLEAYRPHLPTYHHDVDLPIVRSIKRMDIKIVSMQRMSGRTFPVLEDCTIVWPHHPETLCLRGGVHLPACTQFTYDDHLIKPISEIRLPKPDEMVVRNKPRGITSTQLSSVWCESANPRWTRPRVLHLDTQFHDQHLINGLQLHPELEELVLGLVRPDGLGKKFFNTMVARKSKGRLSSLGSRSGPAQPNGVRSGFLVVPLVPKLKVFGVRHRTWIREQEKGEIELQLTSLALCGPRYVLKASASDPDGRDPDGRYAHPCAAIKAEDIPEPSFVGWRVGVIAFVFHGVEYTVYVESPKDEKHVDGGFSVASSRNWM
jgi:hypothetical protein